ncbi:type II toxin-antitoxin system HipA family toxin [soil metagenome]
MKLAPGTPLLIGLRTDDAKADMPIGRLAMAERLAQLEWSPEVLTRSLRISPYLYPPEPGLIAARGALFEGLHGFLADSLPEGWGALLLQRRLRKAGIRSEELSATDRLALVGTQGRGALVFAPATTPEDAIESLDMDELAHEAHQVLLGEEGLLAGTLARLGGASGGARPKIHVGFDSAGQICVGEGETAPGYQAWIVKFAALNDPVDIGPVEFAYASMARSAGIVMADARLIPSQKGHAYFATRRFDRPAPGMRLHMVSLAGAIEAPSNMPSASYDTLLRATRAITRHDADVEQTFRRMVFNVLAHNRDDHTRQHSFLMDETGDWRLAPAYDLTYSNGPGGEHYLDIDGEGRNPTGAQVRTLGRMHGLYAARIDLIIEQVADTVARWPDFAADAQVGVSLAPIAERIAAVRVAF